MDGEGEARDALRRPPVSPGHFFSLALLRRPDERWRQSGEVGEAPW
jgi:hypothetical protein